MAKNRNTSLQDVKNTGFSEQQNNEGRRLLRQDGSYNVIRTGSGTTMLSDVYIRLLTMPWWKFNLRVFFTYLIINTMFAIGYFLMGNEHLAGTVYHTEFERFLESFFFSAQTLTTVGYGRISPMGMFSSGLAAIESMMGLLGFALATGLLYGRFSRPNAKILYSNNVLVSPFKEGKAIMFRVANRRDNELIEVEAMVTLAIFKISEDGKVNRKFYSMPLELPRVNFFPTSWTIVHNITEESPFFDFTKEDFTNTEFEMLIQLKGFDDIFSQVVYSRYSYKNTDLVYGAKFELAFEPQHDGSTLLDLDRMHVYKMVELDAAMLNENK